MRQSTGLRSALQELVKDRAQERNCVDAARFHPSSAPRSSNRPPMIRKIVAKRTKTALNEIGNAAGPRTATMTFNGAAPGSVKARRPSQIQAACPYPQAGNASVPP